MSHACTLHSEKKPFSSRGRALASIYVIKKHGGKRDKKPTRPYLCDGCGRWFLTSQPE